MLIDIDTLWDSCSLAHSVHSHWGKQFSDLQAESGDTYPKFGQRIRSASVVRDSMNWQILRRRTCVYHIIPRPHMFMDATQD